MITKVSNSHNENGFRFLSLHSVFNSIVLLLLHIILFPPFSKFLVAIALKIHFISFKNILKRTRINSQDNLNYLGKKIKDYVKNTHTK